MILINMVENTKIGNIHFQSGGMKNQWAFIYVGNTANALAHRTSPWKNTNPANENLFVTNGKSRPFWQFAQEIDSTAV